MRISRVLGIAVGSLAVVTCCIAGFLVSGDATAGERAQSPGHEPGAVAPARALPDHPVGAAAAEETFLTVTRVSVRALDQVRIPRKSCPREAPLLDRVEYPAARSWELPRGVEVRAGGGITGIFAAVTAFRGDVSTPAWVGDSMSRVANWSTMDREIEVVMHCIRPWNAEVREQYRVGANDVVRGLSISCPETSPYLVDAQSSLPGYPGWQYMFVSGVFVEDRGFIIGDDASAGAILRAVARNGAGYQTGIADMTIIARQKEKLIDVTLFCTDDLQYAAQW